MGLFKIFVGLKGLGIMFGAVGRRALDHSTSPLSFKSTDYLSFCNRGLPARTWFSMPLSLFLKPRMQFFRSTLTNLRPSQAQRLYLIHS